jgi:hypothetical protein
MNRANTFPLPFKSLRTIRGGEDGPYVIGALFTAAYSEKAQRFAASCEKFGLPYVIHEVPTIHRSISSLGSDDLSYTKPNFIRHLLAAYKKPVLYVDVDCEFVAHPALLGELVRSGCDFAVYNKYADEEYTPYFVAVELNLRADEPPIKNRFYRFVGSTRWYTKSQLGCFGCVLFCANSIAARALLSRWQRTTANFRGTTDEKCLDFTFNNLTRRSWLSWLLKVYWLPSSYARLSHWIFTKPIINHPDVPGAYAHAIPIEDPKGHKQFYRSDPRVVARTHPPAAFPQGCIIDTEQRMVCKLVDGQLVPIRPTDQDLWL